MQREKPEQVTFSYLHFYIMTAQKLHDFLSLEFSKDNQKNVNQAIPLVDRCVCFNTYSIQFNSFPVHCIC